MTRIWLLVGALGLVAVSLLSTGRRVRTVGGMKTLTTAAGTKAATKKSLSPAAIRARRRRAEDKADYALAVKRLAALDSGKEKAIPAEEVWRELGI